MIGLVTNRKTITVRIVNSLVMNFSVKCFVYLTLRIHLFKIRSMGFAIKIIELKNSIC